MEIQGRPREFDDSRKGMEEKLSFDEQHLIENRHKSLLLGIKQQVAPEYFGMLEYLLDHIPNNLDEILIQAILHYEPLVFQYLQSAVKIPFLLSRHTMSQLERLAKLENYKNFTRSNLIRSILDFQDPPLNDDFRQFPIVGEQLQGLLYHLATNPKWELLEEEDRMEAFLEHLIVATFMTYQPTMILQQVFEASSDYYQRETVDIAYTDAMKMIPQLSKMEVFVHQSSLYLAGRIDKICSSQ